jgi:hypothetical protein
LVPGNVSDIRIGNSRPYYLGTGIRTNPSGRKAK